MAKRVNKTDKKEINNKVENAKVDGVQVDRFTKLFGLISIGFAIGAFAVVLLVYSGVLPTKINMFGIEFNLPNYCSTACLQQASLSPTLPFTITPTSSPTITPTITSTPTATLTPIPKAKTALEIIDEYYSLINKAIYPSELEKPWGYLSDGYQCDPLFNCDLDVFRVYWWKHRTLYKLFECSNPYQVNVEYTLYKRIDAFYANQIGKPNVVVKYFLDFNEYRELKIISAVVVYGPDDECLLAISRLTPEP